MGTKTENLNSMVTNKYEQLNSLPRPYPDAELWKITLETGFQMYPERKENYLKFQNAKRGETLDYLPIQLDIETISRCNYRCKMCQVSDWENSTRATDMSFEDYKNIIDAQYGLIEVKLQGMGEPLLSKDFFKMIEYARKRYLWVRSTTNASLLHVDENYKEVLNSDICELQVSIDGASKESFEMIRRGGKFNRVKENCVLLNNYGRKINKKRTRMWTVVQQDNFHELKNFPKAAAEMGFERMTMTLSLNRWGKDHWIESSEKECVFDLFDVTDADELIAIGNKYGVEVTFWFADKKFDASDPKKLCPMPFQRFYITSDMKIVPCAGVGDPRTYCLGDARKITEEWNSKKMSAFRRTHFDGNFMHFCTSCYK
jgi:pyrroloquinoline quinone biosynthesis protein E